MKSLAALLYTSCFYSISNRGKWACSSRIGALPPGQKGIVAAARERLRKSWPTSRRIDQAQHVPFSNRSRLQCTSIWVPGGAISHFGLSRIRMLLGKNGYDKVRRLYCFRYFLILYFLNYLNVFSLILFNKYTIKSLLKNYFIY